jgi:hypothetical protein
LDLVVVYLLSLLPLSLVLALLPMGRVFLAWRFNFVRDDGRFAAAVT